uniref:Uncharacterized protein n=1 Tax=Chromera velia CCMP2878 TaxID=1169474 RepID=A0A0G4H4R2_9ALVE|eukprot:Cvel_24671.t1-p1 / transcript=Cvel_24671.t1 / gene=Cvel_24671 / organism=Chromera_velia_CCMP2878 / gene_product=hypothetical protein / transcript_product=hypothetical protein / location=Cvel_scaffold2700:300-9324(-) / protein_length=2013 / sequence_SO=supercontig / SO=protein_coding / is_pseudo=false
MFRSLLVLLCALLVGAQFEPDFKIVSFLPEGGVLRNRQAITVVFNIPVLPLGADLAKESLDAAHTPFTVESLNGNGTVAGTVYWVTTSIARFDPDFDWPTDLKVAVRLNRSLRSASGQKLLEEGLPEDREFLTPTQTLRVISVSSKMAEEATDGKWTSALPTAPSSSSFSRVPSRRASPTVHEVPPDGKVKVRFDFPVSTASLSTTGSDPFVEAVPVRVGEGEEEEEDGPLLLPDGAVPCEDDPIIPVPFFVRLPSPAPSPPFGERTKAEGHLCAEFSFPQSSLQSGKRYELRLKNGAMYHPAAGPSGEGEGGEDNEEGMNMNQPLLTGLRPFQLIPRNAVEGPNGNITASEPVSTEWKRQRVFVNHGLPKGDAALEAFKERLRLSPRVGGGLDVEQVDVCTLQLSGDLKPGETYTLSVRGSEEIKDGLGMPLQDSSIRFTVNPVDAEVASPSVRLLSFPLAAVQRELSSLAAMQTETEVAEFDWPAIVKRALGGGTEETPEPASEGSTTGASRLRGDLLNLPLQRGEAEPTPQPQTPARMPRRVERAEVGVSPMSVDEEGDALKNLNHIKSLFWNQQAAAEPDRTFDLLAETDGEGGNAKIANVTLSLGETSKFWRMDKDTEFCTTVQRTASQRVTPASTLPSRAVRGLQAEPEERCFDSAEQTMVSIPSVQISTVKFYTRREKAVEKEGEEGESLHTEMETAYRMAARVQSLEETGAGVEKATVALWSLERRSSTVSLASSAETDKDGVAVVDFLMDGPSTAHVLTVTLADGETYVSPTLDYSFGMRTTTDRYILGSVDTGAAPDVQGFSASDVRGVWSTDRAVYKPGEDLAVHGYAVASPKACAATAAAVGVERTEADGPCPLEALEANKKPLAVLMKFTWGRNSWRDQKCSLVKVPLDAAFGSFQTEVPVPPDADYGILQNPDFAIVSQEYELSEQLLEKPCTYLNSYGLMQFTSVKGPSNIVIADPRPPSVIINLDVPPFVPPQNGTASLPVSGSLMTFTGSPVMQLVDLTLEISLQTVEKKNGQEEEDEESGDAQEKTVDIPTGSEDVKATLLPQQKKLILSALDLYSASEDGSFAFTFQIPKGDGDGENQPYTFRATAGDALLVTAEAKGLAGEFVTETMTSAVDRSPLYISHLELLPSQPLPGRLFSVSATVKERPRAPASADATNAKVQVTMLEAQQPLYERQQTDATYQYFDYAYVLPSGRAPQSIPCSQVIAPFLLESGGVDIDSMVASGNFTLKGTCEDAASPECALRMDALKHHIVIAQVGDSEEAFSTGCAYVGKTLEEWEAAPLTSFSPTGLQAKLVEPEVHFGEVAKLSIENSFHGDADLTVFVGTGDYGKVLTFTVPPNQDAEKKRTVSEFELGPVPSDCLGGCPVYVFLSAPLSLDGSLLKSISPLPPMSPLLPDFGPQLLEKFLTLKAKRPDEGVEAVSVTLRPGTSEGEEDGTPNGGIGLSAGGRGEEGLPVFAPGQTVEAEVEVLVAPPLSSAEETTVPQEEEVDVEVEVTLLVVDSSLLELRPLEMMEAEDALVVFDPNMIVDNGYSSLEHFASPEGLHEAARILAQRANEDPHAKVSPLPSLASDRDSQRLHEGVEEFLKKHFGMITTGPGVSNGNSNFLPFMSRGGVFSETFAMRGAVADSAVPESYSAVPQMAFATASAPAAGGSAGGPGGAGLSVALRQDFARRVAFVTGTGTGRGTGTVSVSVKLPFELPDNEGEFTVRAFTTTRRSSATPSTSTSAESSSAAALTPATLHWSSTETALISRIPALLRPALPRFLRVGDSAEVGAALVLAPEVRTQAPNAAFRVELMELSGASLLEEDQKVQIVTPDSATERIFWKVRADRGLGTATVRFGLSLQMEDGLLVPLDAVEETIEVLPHQSKVVVGTSSSLSASALLEGTEGETSAVVQEALALPSAVPGFGGLNLTAASGFSAGILGLMDSVRGGAFKDYRGKPIEHPGGGSLLSYLFASSVISDAYGIPLSQEAQSAARKALKLLPEYTDSEGACVS